MKNKKIMSLLTALLAITFILQYAAHASATSYSWYCKRVAGNVQPPLPSEFEFISGHDAVWLNVKRGANDNSKVAYLTFDAGYENGNIAKILDILNEKQVPGAFFILINLINTEPELVKRMADEGHLVCNHTAHHKDMSRLTEISAFERELKELSDAYERLTEKKLAPFYRPPEGRFSEVNLIHAKSMGYKTVFWSFAYADWDNNNQPSAEYARKKILDNIHNGAVLLLHPTSAVNAEILGDIIDTMRSKGYEFGTLEELYSEISKN